MSPEYRKVEALLSLGRGEEAAALVDGLPQREQPTPEYLRLRGRALRAAGRVFDAEAAFREALAMQPRDAGLMADLATTLYGQKRHRDAIGFARDAVGARPEVAAYHCLLGVIAEALELDDEAERALGSARAMAPQDPEAHTVYGFHALRRGRVEPAERAFGDAVRAAPSHPEALRGLARCALARGDWGAARARWLDALKVDPKQRDRRLQRALVVGHPWLAPVRVAERVPFWVSATCAAAAVAAMAVVPQASVALLVLSAVGPAARIVVNGR